jgi:hypothetical protein
MSNCGFVEIILSIFYDVYAFYTFSHSLLCADAAQYTYTFDEWIEYNGERFLPSCKFLPTLAFFSYSFRIEFSVVFIIERVLCEYLHSTEGFVSYFKFVTARVKINY